MFRLTRPIPDQVRDFLAGQKSRTFTYAEVGATAATPPKRFNLDHTRMQLGIGEAAFELAKAALRGWRQFDLGWIYAAPDDTPIRVGSDVAVVAASLGTWMIGAARIVYVIDEPRRFGFAYGTLPGHPECGEERFLVERLDDDSVWYDIIAFSRPRHPLTWLGYPLVRRLQKRFGRESCAAMRRLAAEKR